MVYDVFSYGSSLSGKYDVSRPLRPSTSPDEGGVHSHSTPQLVLETSFVTLGSRVGIRTSVDGEGESFFDLLILHFLTVPRRRLHPNHP